MTDTKDQINYSMIKDDLYQAVNGEWLKTATIPADHASAGGFMDLNDNIDKELMADFADLQKHATDAEGPMAEFLKLYALAANFQKRDQDGAAPLKPLLKQIEDLPDMAALNAQLSNWVKIGLPLPFNFDVDADMKNTSVNALFAGVPGLFLPDKTYYAKDNPAKDQLLTVFSNMTQQLLVMADYSSAEAEAIVKSAIRFDENIAPHVKSAEESADYSKMYNPMSFSEFAQSTSELDLTALAKDLFDQVPEQIIVTEPAYYQALAGIMNLETFDDMKNWMLVKTINAYSSYLSEEFRQTGSTFSRTLSGRKATTSQPKSAFYLASGVFGQTVGDFYAHKYFGDKAKADVEHMVKQMIAVYKNRLSTNQWLGEATRQKAILKLDTLELQVGFPDQIDPLEYKFKITTAENGGSLMQNIRQISEISRLDNYAQLGKPVDRSRWEMSASTVNAYYHPFKNIIVFPAAILQAPFYSLDQSSSQNYGGIGAVIAHEISHAFDNNGALFDEHGNLNNWWTKEDHEHFQKLADQMIQEFDGLPFAGSKVNGKLTVSENIADAGGLSCAEEAAKNEADYDLTAFFTNWARVWRTKATKEYQQLLLNIDVHAPAELRANVQVKNLADFYTTFNVTETDEMYLAPAKRVTIW